MPINRRELLTASVAGAAILRQGREAFAAPPGNIQVAIDAAKSGKPIDPMIFGGYMEPATTGRQAGGQRSAGGAGAERPPGFPLPR